MDYDDDIFSIEYESFSYGLDYNEDLDVCFCIKYEHRTFDPMISDLILEKSKPEFLQAENFVPMNANLDHTLEHINIKGIMDLEPNDLPR